MTAIARSQAVNAVNNDTGTRAWLAWFLDCMLDAGFTQTADTGQANPVTADSDDMGNLRMSFTDENQAEQPMVYQFWFSMDGFGNPTLICGVGTAVSSGALTNGRDFVGSISAESVAGSTQLLSADAAEGRFCWMGGTDPNAQVIMERLSNGDGTPSTEGAFVFLRADFGGSSGHKQLIWLPNRSGDITDFETNSRWPVRVPMLSHSYIPSGESDPGVHLCVPSAYIDYQPLRSMLAVSALDVTHAAMYGVEMYGVVRNYRVLETNFPNDALVTDGTTPPSNTCGAILWEEEGVIAAPTNMMQSGFPLGGAGGGGGGPGGPTSGLGFPRYAPGPFGGE